MPTALGKSRTVNFRKMSIQCQQLKDNDGNAVDLASLASTIGSASATAGAATLAKRRGKITSEALTTAAGANYTLTITNTEAAAADMVFASVANGTNTTEGLSILRVTPGAGSIVIVVRNAHASAALNGTIVVSFEVVKA